MWSRFHGLEVRVQLVREKKAPYLPDLQIQCSRDVVNLVGADLRCLDREVLLVLGLDSRHRVLGVNVASQGTLNAAHVFTREILKPLLLCNAASFILVHNHPSNGREPSEEDRLSTKRAKEAGDLMGIPLLDHLILASEGTYSFADHGEI